MLDICPLRQQLLDCDCHALVIGGPGSGKTTIALGKAVKRIERGLTSGQSVLFLSFSRAAVARIAQASKTEAAKDQRPLLNLQTFHSFFWELLRSHGYLLGMPKRLHILLPHDERALSNGIKEGELLWPARITERERLWKSDGPECFRFISPVAATLLEKSSHLRTLVAQHYPLFIVDEAQDTNAHAWHCIELLAPHAQIVCLADLEQQIFDYLPGVGPQRIEEIKAALSPLLIDLGTDNHRSPNSEIVAFGNDILVGRERGSKYVGVSKLPYNPKTVDWAKTVRMALGILQKSIRADTGDWGRHIAILVASGSAAARLSAVLNSANKPVRHKLLFDEAEAMLAARFAAFLLEPRHSNGSYVGLSKALELLADMKRANGLAEARTLRVWATKVQAGKIPKAAFVTRLQTLLESIDTLCGDPGRDWIMVKKLLRASGDVKLIQIAKHLDYLVAFNRGRRISASLTEVWQRDGQYTNAREVLDSALAQDQVIGGADDPDGVELMTIHKAKGKQFDGVIVIRRSHHDGKRLISTFVWKGDAPPYTRSRKILRVAVTRAKVHTVILDPVWPRCPILGGHSL